MNWIRKSVRVSLTIFFSASSLFMPPMPACWRRTISIMARLIPPGIPPIPIPPPILFIPPIIFDMSPELDPPDSDLVGETAGARMGTVLLARLLVLLPVSLVHSVSLVIQDITT